MVAATFFFVALDTTGKHLASTYPVEQVVWARFAFHLLFVALWLGTGLPHAMRSRRPGLQALRSVLMLCANGAAFLALRSLPLVDVSVLIFTSPLIVTALSGPLLGERVGARRWAAVAIGLVGALIVIRPGPALLQGVALVPLVAAFSFSLYQIATRRLSRHDSAMTMLLYTPVAGVALTSAILPVHWQTPDLWGWALMAFAGLVGLAGQLCLIRAIQAAPLPVIAPFNYLALIWSTLAGVLIFGDLPDAATMLGAAIIVASGLYVVHRERLRARDATAPGATPAVRRP
jgi:drug/metabolite transporter (DMT)-like permease